MTIAAITKIVIAEVDLLSNYTSTEIKALYDPPDKDPKLSKLFSSSLKVLLAPNLKRKMKFVRSTHLTNELFVTIKTLGQLIKAVKAYYDASIN